MKTLFSLLVVLVVLASGCAHEGAYVAKQHTRFERPLNTVVFMDQGLSRALSLEKSGARRSPSDMLEVWADLRNRTDDPVTVSGRVTFYDEAQRPIDTSVWTQLFLQPRSQEVFRASSRSAGALYYYIEIDRAK